MFREIIWAHKPLRLKLQLLTMSKSKRDIGLPDVARYYKAADLFQVVDWHCNKSSKQWVSIEIDDAYVPLQSPQCLFSQPEVTCRLNL